MRAPAKTQRLSGASSGSELGTILLDDLLWRMALTVLCAFAGCSHDNDSVADPSIPSENWLVREAVVEWVEDIELTSFGLYIAGGRDGFHFMDFDADSLVKCGPVDTTWNAANFGVGARSVAVCGSNVYFGISPTRTPGTSLFVGQTRRFIGSSSVSPIAIQSRNIIALASSHTLGAVGISGVDGAFVAGECGTSWDLSTLAVAWKIARVDIQDDCAFAYGESPIELPEVFRGSPSENNDISWVDELGLNQIVYLSKLGSQATGFAELASVPQGFGVLGLRGPEGGVYLLDRLPENNVRILDWPPGPLVAGNHEKTMTIIVADSLYLLRSVSHEPGAELTTLGCLPYATGARTRLSVNWQIPAIAISAHTGFDAPILFVRKFAFPLPPS